MAKSKTTLILLPIALAAAVIGTIIAISWPTSDDELEATDTQDKVSKALAFAREACLANPTLRRNSGLIDASAEARLTGLLKGKSKTTKEELEVIVDQAISQEDRASQYDKIRDCIKDRIIFYINDGKQSEDGISLQEKFNFDQTSEAGTTFPKSIDDAKKSTESIKAVSNEISSVAIQTPVKQVQKNRFLLRIGYASLYRMAKIHVKINGEKAAVFNMGKGPACSAIPVKAAPGDTWEISGLIVTLTREIPAMEYNIFPHGEGKFINANEDSSIEFSKVMGDGSVTATILTGEPYFGMDLCEV